MKNFNEINRTFTVKKTKFLQRVLWLMIPLLTIFTTNAWGATATLSASCFGSNVSNYSTSEASITDANGNTWKVKGYGMVKSTSVTIGKAGANYLQTPNFSGDISKIVVTCSGSYYLKVVDNSGTQVCAQQAASGGTLTFNVSGSYTQLKLYSKRQNSESSNAATTITNVVVTYAGSSCSNIVTLSKGSETHGEVTSFSTTTLQTCSATATERDVTIKITPEDGYDAPSTLTWTKSSGTISDPTKQSGPTAESDGTYSYVYRFAQNQSGTGTFGVTCSASTPKTYILTTLEALTSSDVFIIVGTSSGGTHYMMSNNNGTSSAPSAPTVTITDNTITTAKKTILWNISGNASDGYTFYPNGTTAKWLYCTSSNDGVRVGTNANKTFTVSSGYLYHTGATRYVGVYTNNPDWRCYTSINSNIENQTFSYYKEGSPCVGPTALTKGTISLSDRTNQTQPINWTSAAGKVDICYSTSSTKPGETPGSGYTVASNITSSPYNINITNLAAGNYYVWARSVCDASTRSDWVAVTGSYFTIPGHTLTINASPASSGTFTKSPNISTVVENRQVSITATPAAGYNFSSWSVSGTGAALSSTSTNPTTFTMGTADATVTGTFTAKPLVSISLSAASGEVYVGQYVTFDITYNPSDVLTKGTNLVATPSYCVTTGTTNTTLKITGGRSGVNITENVTETVSIKANADNTKTASVTITVKPLPLVHFTDVIHGESFSDVVATISANALVDSKMTPTHADFSGSGANTCEDEHVHLVGWILKDWADAHPNATSSEISEAGSTNYITAGAAINVSTFNGKTFYAVWSKVE